jgi:hypothetical protein
MSHPHSHSIPANDSSSKFLNIPVRVWGWIFLVAAYSFLAFKLITFKQYPEFLKFWQEMPISQFWWLAAVFLFLPFNWLIESVKWKMMTTHVQKISLMYSIKGVLAGISTGFFTPNRLGEMVGRIMYLNPENRKAGVTLSLVSSLTQNIIMTLGGIPACILFFGFTARKVKIDIDFYLTIVGICITALCLFYFLLPKLSQKLNQSRFSIKINDFTDCLSAFSLSELIRIILISFFRYFVFCIQFSFMLRFFGVELTAWEMLISIPTTYLFVTFTPSFAFSEVAVRGSLAVLIIGTFSPQTIGIALAGMCIWMVNFVIPMLVGSVMMLKKQQN